MRTSVDVEPILGVHLTIEIDDDNLPSTLADDPGATREAHTRTINAAIDALTAAYQETAR